MSNNIDKSTHSRHDIKVGVEWNWNSSEFASFNQKNCDSIDSKRQKIFQKLHGNYFEFDLVWKRIFS